LDTHSQIYEVIALEASPTPQEYELLDPFFEWASEDTIKNTLSQPSMLEEESLITYGKAGNLVSRLVMSNIAMKQLLQAVLLVILQLLSLVVSRRKSFFADVFVIKTDK
jgi:hypothetical protein